MSKSDPKPQPHSHSRGFGVTGKFKAPAKDARRVAAANKRAKQDKGGDK